MGMNYDTIARETRDKTSTIGFGSTKSIDLDIPIPQGFVFKEVRIWEDFSHIQVKLCKRIRVLKEVL